MAEQRIGNCGECGSITAWLVATVKGRFSARREGKCLSCGRTIKQ